MGGNVSKSALKSPKPTRSESVTAPFRFVSITSDGDLKEQHERLQRVSYQIGRT